MIANIEYAGCGYVANAAVAFNFYERPGEILANFSSESTKAQFVIVPEKGRFVCEIPKFPMAAGTYFGNLYLELGGEVADWIEGAFTVQVEASDFYSTGKLPPQGKFFVEHTWHVDGLQFSQQAWV